MVLWAKDGRCSHSYDTSAQQMLATEVPDDDQDVSKKKPTTAKPKKKKKNEGAEPEAVDSIV